MHYNAFVSYRQNFLGFFYIVILDLYKDYLNNKIKSKRELLTKWTLQAVHYNEL